MYDTEPVRGVGDGVDSAINMATQQEDDTGRENRLIRLLRLMRLLKLMRLVRFKRILDRWEDLCEDEAKVPEPANNQTLVGAQLLQQGC